jgi:hypothetical protein
MEKENRYKLDMKLSEPFLSFLMSNQKSREIKEQRKYKIRFFDFFKQNLVFI